MERKINIARFKEGSRTAEVKGIWQWDYGQILRIQGLILPTAVEIHFSLDEHGGEAARRIGVTKDGVTDVPIPDLMVENESAYGDSYYFFAYVYLSDEESGNTEYKIRAKVSTRSRPEGYVSGGNDTFAEILKTVNEIAEDKVDIPASAKVGQVLAVKETDESGKPTEFEAKDMSGGVSEEKIAEAVETYMEAHPIEETLDETLTDNTKAAPAGMVGELKRNLEQLKQNGTGTGSGLTVAIKEALMDAFEHIGLWNDGDGQAYIDALRKALYNAPIASISAVYNQSKTVYASDTLDVLKDGLTVTATYTDGTSSEINDYTLSGTLTVGTSTITVTADGVTTTFNVAVTASRVPATGITLNNTTLSFTGSKAIQLTATVEPLNSTDTVVWSSSENAVATVENGLVTPIADGSCTIYATSGDYTAECKVTVTLPISGFNMGNPFLMLDATTLPHESGLTEEELQNKWYSSQYTSWATALGTSGKGYIYLHPLSEGTYYVRSLSDAAVDKYKAYAFSNADIGTNPTTTLGLVGDTYTDATIRITGFECDYEDKYGRPNLGAWEYVDGSGSTGGDSIIQIQKIVVPKDVYVFLAMSGSFMKVSKNPGISETFQRMNDMYTIFDANPSGNVTQLIDQGVQINE